MTVQLDLSQYDHIERALYYLQLGKLWEHVRVHLGDEITQRVVSFLFREDFLEEHQRTQILIDEFPLTPQTALNAVRLDTDDIVAFPPFPAPEIPGSMKVSLTEIS